MMSVQLLGEKWGRPLEGEAGRVLWWSSRVGAGEAGEWVSVGFILFF